MTRIGFYFFVTCLLIAGLAWGALQSVPPIPKLFHQQDKLEHLLAFGALTLWLTAMLKPSRWMLAALISAFGAVGLETAQAAFSPARTASGADVLASLIGITLATAFVLTARKTLRGSAPPPCAA